MAALPWRKMDHRPPPKGLEVDRPGQRGRQALVHSLLFGELLYRIPQLYAWRLRSPHPIVPESR